MKFRHSDHMNPDEINYEKFVLGLLWPAEEQARAVCVFINFLKNPDLTDNGWAIRDDLFFAYVEFREDRRLQDFEKRGDYRRSFERKYQKVFRMGLEESVRIGLLIKEDKAFKLSDQCSTMLKRMSKIALSLVKEDVEIDPLKVVKGDLYRKDWKRAKGIEKKKWSARSIIKQSNLIKNLKKKDSS